MELGKSQEQLASESSLHWSYLGQGNGASAT